MRTNAAGRATTAPRLVSSLIAAFLAAGAPCCRAGGAVPMSSDPRDRLERIVVDLEGGRTAPELKRAWSSLRDHDIDPIDKALRDTYRSIDTLLARDSADVRTLVLAARFSRVSGALGVEWEHPGDDFKRAADTFDRVRAVLRHGIALNPGSAELHYQLARVCGSLVLFEQGTRNVAMHPVDRFEAAAECRRALELDSTRSEYRKFLAVFLLMGPHPDDAEPVVRGHEEFVRLHALVTDWAALPDPPGAVPDLEAYDVREEHLFRDVIDDWTIARVRVLAFDGPASALESYYASVMPGFRLYPAQGGNGYGDHVVWRRQVVVMHQGRYSPSTSEEDCARRKPWGGPMMELVVAEIPGASPLGPAQRLGLTHDPYCIVRISNWRKPKSIDDGR